MSGGRRRTGGVPRPLDEQARLAALGRYRVLDSDVQAELQPILRLALQVSGAPHAVVNIIDAATQWQIAAAGGTCVNVDRDTSMCARTIWEDDVLHVGDASTHPSFRENPFVTGELGDVRMYVGVPLRTADGYALGTLCVTADRPGILSEQQLASLRDLGCQIVAVFDLHCRREQAELIRDEHAAGARLAVEREREMRSLLDAAEEGMLALDAQGRCSHANRTAAALLGYEPMDLLGRELHTIIHRRQANGLTCCAEDCPVLAVLGGHQHERGDVGVFWRCDDSPLPVRYSLLALTQDHALTGAVITFTPLDEDEARAHALDADSIALRHAIEGQELTLVYQPKICLATGRCSGVEALVRWRHPDEGVLTPDRFIPLAERNGLIGPLTVWLVVEAIRQCRAWRDNGVDVSVAVNVSPRALLEIDLGATASRALRACGVPPSSIGFELTETAVMSEPERMAALLNRMAAFGIEVAIDDFGTGYGSLTYLRDLPVTTIKIDRSFVARLHHSERAVAIVRSTIDLAHNLGQTVVAEGVEDGATANALRAIGCDEAQGYHWSRPLPPNQLATWVSGRTCRPREPSEVRKQALR